jgi:hypothetical protein
LNYLAYARLVAEAAGKRRLSSAAAQMIEAHQGNAGADEFAFRLDNLQAALSAVAAPAATTVGTRTARDLLHGIAPDPLVTPFLSPEGPTVIYGKGGVGKGLFASYLVKRLIEAGHIVLLVNFEGHEREWGFRLRGLGLTDEQLDRIHYLAPFGQDWTAPTGSLADVADLLREEASRLGASYLIIDSYSVATSTGDTLGGMPAATEYFNALTRIGLPSTTLAHVAGATGRFPDRPFGSVFVHNLARETWAVERTEDSFEEIDPDTWPKVVSLELRNKKQNDRPEWPPQFMTFNFYGDGTIEVNRDRPTGRSVADLAADALAGGPLTLDKIIRAIKEDTGQIVGEGVLRSALLRHTQRFLHDASGKRPHPWSLR